MKIGIITFWESNDNYGQVLQAFALQRVLEDLGHAPYQIKYSIYGNGISVGKTSTIRRIFKFLLIYPFLKHIIKSCRLRKESKLYLIIESKNQRRNFVNFRRKYINQSIKVYKNIFEIQNDPPIADVYITGSDQVWNMSLSNYNNRVFFLDFGEKKTKRISYAASFAAKDYPLEHKKELKGLLENLDSISVREDEGVNICRNVGVAAVKTVDPTFLLPKHCYTDLINGVQTCENHIFIYQINIKTPEEIRWGDICSYAQKTGLHIIATTSSGSVPGREILKDVDYLYATIPEWLANINSSKVVITTSFHGVAFCLIMHANFVYIPLMGKSARGNGRVYSLLKSVGLESKIAQKDKSLEDVINQEVCWNDVDEKIEKQREYSIGFLKRSI